MSQQLQLRTETLEEENGRLRLENESLAKRLQDAESELIPLRLKLRVTEQALLFNSDLMYRHLEESMLKLNEIKRHGSNGSLSHGTSLTQSRDKELEIASLKEQLIATESKIHRLFATEIQPLQHKLHVAEQALLFNSDPYLQHDMREKAAAHIAAKNADADGNRETNQGEIVADIVESNPIDETKSTQALTMEIEFLRHKLIIAQQALLFNSNLYQISTHGAPS
eukprot:TRINITY_DN1424_c0_g1_i1.p1 TRINITY_DN1424_c0_g1~~TRINITY_DN1424_c0_g1_i1.p1  ORF type:complete len:225 (-),score=58.50 TRINITY_DN1424_c0_g1_i1:533-1207(-)